MDSFNTPLSSAWRALPASSGLSRFLPSCSLFSACCLDRFYLNVIFCSHLSPFEHAGPSVMRAIPISALFLAPLTPIYIC